MRYAQCHAPCNARRDAPSQRRHVAEDAGRAAPTTAAQDAWSLGVSLAAAALGANPFARPHAAATRAAVLAGVGCDRGSGGGGGGGSGGGGGGGGGGSLGADPLAPLSPALRHLLRCLLRPDPIFRLSCEAVLTHPWATATAASAGGDGDGGGDGVAGVAGAGGVAEPSVASLARAERRHKWSADVVRQRFEHAGAEGARRGGVALGQAPGALQKVLASVPMGMLVAAGRAPSSFRRDSA